MIPKSKSSSAVKHPFLRGVIAAGAEKPVAAFDCRARSVQLLSQNTQEFVAARLGMRKVNVLPCPGIDCISILPPCRATMRLHVASPSPNPVEFPAVGTR